MDLTLSKEVDEIIDNEVSCPVCLEIYDQAKRMPKLLPCLSAMY